MEIGILDISDKKNMTLIDESHNRLTIEAFVEKPNFNFARSEYNVERNLERKYTLALFHRHGKEANNVILYKKASDDIYYKKLTDEKTKSDMKFFHEFFNKENYFEKYENLYDYETKMKISRNRNNNAYNYRAIVVEYIYPMHKRIIRYLFENYTDKVDKIAATAIARTYFKKIFKREEINSYLTILEKNKSHFYHDTSLLYRRVNSIAGIPITQPIIPIDEIHKDLYCFLEDDGIREAKLLKEFKQLEPKIINKQKKYKEKLAHFKKSLAASVLDKNLAQEIMDIFIELRHDIKDISEIKGMLFYNKVSFNPSITIPAKEPGTIIKAVADAKEWLTLDERIKYICSESKFWDKIPLIFDIPECIFLGYYIAKNNLDATIYKTIFDHFNKNITAMVYHLLTDWKKEENKRNTFKKVHQIIQSYIYVNPNKYAKEISLYPLFFRCGGKDCIARLWPRKENEKIVDDKRLYCYKKNRPCNKEKAHMYINQDLPYTQWTIMELLAHSGIQLKDIPMDGPEQYMHRMADALDRANNLKDRLKCRECHKLMKFSIKSWSAEKDNIWSWVHFSVIADCENSEPEHDHHVYLNHCFGCREIIDSRDCKHKTPKDSVEYGSKEMYLCMHCGMPDPTICPKCGRKRSEPVTPGQTATCSFCGHKIHVPNARKNKY